MARKKDTDVYFLYVILGVSLIPAALGGDVVIMNMVNVVAAIAFVKANKFGTNIYMLHHPNAVVDLVV